MKGKLQSISLILIATLSTLVFSCETEEKLSPERDSLFKKFYGTAFDESARDLAILENGDILLLGTTSSLGNGGQDIYLVKTDAYGDYQWEKTFGGALNDGGSSITLDSEGNILITGFVTEANGNKDYALLKVDQEGNLLDSLTVGRKNFSEEGERTVITQDGGFVIGGNVLRGNDVVDNYFYKISASGDSLWTVSVNFLEGLGALSSLVETSAGEILWSSTTNTGGGSDSNIVIGLIEKDGQSNQLAFYGENNGINEIGNDLTSTAAGWVISGSAKANGGNSDLLLLGINTTGRLKVSWDQVFGTELSEEARGVALSTNGTMIIAGVQEVGADNNDILLCEATFNGDIRWSKVFGGNGDDRGSQVAIVDGDILVMGTSEIENNDVLTLIKTNSKGEFSSTNKQE
ncbi:hypothetical protein E1176_12380 [Fulvivirga sp. RKSG066]|uniref:hypothetical protein n=1 Tax=Fulvivirga aurantia TaxID=2529383 RepID=UPI0012BC1272|nr:hypothetical protein [Fulvivirga aurantia]MTI21820.1 hypothetical protein [Fulvivirga aurantia]